MALSNSSDCSLWPENPQRCTTILICQKIFSSLSVIGTLSVITIIIIMRAYKAFVQKMILSLAISAFFNSIAYVITGSTKYNFCQFQAFFMQYFDWSTLLWVFCITLNCFRIVVFKRSLSKYFIWLHGFVWIASLIVSAIPFIFNAYGNAGLWCWVERDHLALRFGIWYAPLLFLCGTMLVMYSYIIWKVVQASSPRHGGFSEAEQRQNKIYRNDLKPLLAYPFIYVIFFIPAFIYRIEDAVHRIEPPKFVLTVLTTVFVPTIGFTYSICFLIFDAGMQQLSWFKVKNGIVTLFSSKISHQIHENYEVRDAPVSTMDEIQSASSIVEMQEIRSLDIIPRVSNVNYGTTAVLEPTTN